MAPDPPGASPRSAVIAAARHICLAAQPASVFGTPDLMVERGVDETLAATSALADAIVSAVRGKTSATTIRSAIDGAADRFGTRRIEAPVRRELLQGSMLGALDSWYEGENDAQVKVEAFGALHAHPRLLAQTDTQFAARPLAEAIKRFLERETVTRDVFDQMEAAAKKRAFTVANAASEEMVRTVKRELLRQIAVGADLAEFGKHAAARFESAGWTPANPSHVETVFRTNVVGAYNGGRARQMTQPEVLELRPFWQWLGVGDGPPRQRPTHQAMHGIVLRANDPFWQRCYPPAGYNCRCRVRSLSLTQGAPMVQEGTGGIFSRMPDEGFTSGIEQLLAA
jgi:SPP1 gp7 family putative phage head morphogenesis protein